MGRKPRPVREWPEGEQLQGGIMCADQLYLLANAQQARTEVVAADRMGANRRVVSDKVQVVAFEALEGLDGFDLGVLLRDGKVLLIRKGQVIEEDVREGEGKRKRGLWLGKLMRLRVVGDELYATGENQIYRRSGGGGWKRMALPVKEDRKLWLADVTRQDGRLYFSGYELFDGDRQRLREALAPHEYIWKLKERTPILWCHEDGHWSECESPNVDRVARRKGVGAMLIQATGSRVAVWDSAGRRVSRGQVEVTLPCECLPADAVSQGGMVYTSWEGSIYCIDGAGDVSALPQTDEQQLRLLGASRSGLLACGQLEFYSLEHGAQEWKQIPRSEALRAGVARLNPHETYGAFIDVFGDLYGAVGGVDGGALVAWNGVAESAAGQAPPDDEDGAEYWLHNLARLYGLEEAEEAARDPHVWGVELLDKGYPIGVGFDGSPFIQSTTGAVYHCYGDEWIEEEDRDELRSLSVDAFFDEWGHHFLADDFQEFYRLLCRQKGAVACG